jgi:tetratricopeptide (TPR) repeat protein
LGTAYRGLGVVAQAQGEHIQAVKIFQKSLETFTELGGTWWVARVLADKSRSIFELGNDDEAGRVWCESLRIAAETRGIPVALEALAGFANLEAKRGDIEHALELVLIILAHPASFQETKDRTTHLRTELEAKLTHQQVKVVQSRVRSKSFEAVVDEVLMKAN